jgi:hypothetical protein
MKNKDITHVGSPEFIMLRASIPTQLDKNAVDEFSVGFITSLFGILLGVGISLWKKNIAGA